MPVITSPGVGSGLDVTSIVNALVDAEIVPARTALNKRTNSVNSDISALGKITSALESFKTAITDLETSDNFNLRKATISDEKFLSADIDDTAKNGIYDIEVRQLAQAQTIASQSYTAITDVVSVDGGTLSLTVGGNDNSITNQTAVDITIDAGATLSDIKDAINGSNSTFNASIITTNGQSFLTISNKDSGLDNGFSITTTDLDGNNTDTSGLSSLVYDPANAIPVTNATKTITAQNAKFVINGLGNLTPLENSSNTLTNTIEGVTVNLLKSELGTTTRLTVDSNADGLKEKLDSFVTSYNSLIKSIDDQTFYDADTQESGPLRGDSMLRGLKQQLRAQFSESITTNSSFDAFIDIGLETDRDGILSLNSTNFTAAQDSNYDDIALFFSDGAFDIFNGFVDGYTNSTDGIITLQTESLDSRLKGLDNQKFSLDAREARAETRYLRQFAGLDVLLGQLQAQNNFISQQLANLPTFSYNRK